MEEHYLEEFHVGTVLHTEVVGFVEAVHSHKDSHMAGSSLDSGRNEACHTSAVGLNQ